MLIDEASDRTLKQAFDNFLREQNLAQLQKDDELNSYRLGDFSLKSEDFNTIKVQLLALPLISKSAKKKARSVSDKNAYWMLTPYGEAVMMTLRTIRKSETANTTQTTTENVS